MKQKTKDYKDYKASNGQLGYWWKLLYDGLDVGLQSSQVAMVHMAFEDVIWTTVEGCESLIKVADPILWQESIASCSAEGDKRMAVCILGNDHA